MLTIRALVRRLLALVALIPGAAFAAVPVQLPAGEAPADWQSALAQGDFAVAPASGSGPGIVIVKGPQTWTMTIRDGKGGQQVMNVLPPASGQDREDLIWLAVDVLRSAGAVVAAPAPAPPVAPVTPIAPVTPVASVTPVTPVVAVTPPPVASPPAATPPVTKAPAPPAVAPSETAQAERTRLREDLPRLAQRNAWPGVEEAYVKLVGLAAKGLAVEPIDHAFGAQAALAMGRPDLARERFEAARKLGAPEADGAIAQLDANFGGASVSFPRGYSGERKLLAAAPPLEPSARATIETASKALGSGNAWKGLLPVGTYTVDGQTLTVTPGGSASLQIPGMTPSVAPWLELGGGADLRGSLGTGADLRLGGGVAAGPLRALARVDVRTRGEIGELGGSRTAGAQEFSLGVGAGLGGSWDPRALALLSYARRTFVEDGDSAGVVGTPAFGLELAAQVPLAAGWGLSPFVDGIYDFVPVRVVTPTRTVDLSPLSLRGGVSLTWHP